MTEQERPAGTSDRARSMVWVAAGLGIFGLAGFVFLALAGRDLSPAGSAPVAVAWTILNAVGIGLFQPLEQETSRRLSASRARDGGGPRLGTMIRYATLSGATILVVGLVLLPWLGDLLFSGAREIVVVVVFGLLGQGLAYLARGVLAGSDDFSRYGAQLAVDGGLRIVLATLLFTTGQGTRLTYGLVLVVAPVVATLVTIQLGRLRAVWTTPRGAGSTGSMTPLVASSTASQLLANFGPIAMAMLATAAQQDLSGRFVAAVTVARIPLFVFAAVQAVFLPALAGLVARGDVAGFGRSVRQALVVTLTLGVLGVAGIAVLGRWIMDLVYGDEFAVSSSILVLVAVSAALFMLAQVFAQALLAHDLERVTAIAWTLGIVASCATLLLPWELATRVSVALCTGALVSLCVLGAALLRHLSRWRPAVSGTITPEVR